MFSRALVSDDGSESCMKAANTAIELARIHKSELTVLHVIPPIVQVYVPVTPVPTLTDYYELARKDAEKWMAQITSEAAKKGVKAKAEVVDATRSVVEEMTDYASLQKVDLIAIGTRGLSTFKKLLLGNVSTGVISYGHCPVLVVR